MKNGTKLRMGRGCWWTAGRDDGQGRGCRGCLQLLTSHLETGAVCSHHQCSAGCDLCEQLGCSRRTSLSQHLPSSQTDRQRLVSAESQVPKGINFVVGELQGAVEWRPRLKCLSSCLDWALAVVHSGPVSTSLPDDNQDG